MRHFIIFMAMTICLLAASSPVIAHPHIFVTPTAHFSFSDKIFNFFSVKWYFDDISTEGFLGSQPPNSSYTLNDTEQSGLLKLSGYPSLTFLSGYCYVEIDGSKEKLSTPADVKFTVENGRLVYSFTYGVYRSVNKTAKIWFDDREYNIAFDTPAGNYTVSQSSNPQPTIALREERYIDKIIIRL